MTTTISKNYIITALLMAKANLKINEKYISINEYNIFCGYLSDVIGTNAFINSDEIDTDYFHYEQNNMNICLNEPNSLGLEKIKNRYIAYLPFEVLEILYGNIALQLAFKTIIREKEDKIVKLISEINAIKKSNKNLNLEEDNSVKFISTGEMKIYMQEDASPETMIPELSDQSLNLEEENPFKFFTAEEMKIYMQEDASSETLIPKLFDQEKLRLILK